MTGYVVCFDADDGTQSVMGTPSGDLFTSRRSAQKLADQWLEAYHNTIFVSVLKVDTTTYPRTE